MQTASSSQSYIHVHLQIVVESHDQFRRGRVGNVNDLDMHISALGRSVCSDTSVVYPLTDSTLASFQHTYVFPLTLGLSVHNKKNISIINTWCLMYSGRWCG